MPKTPTKHFKEDIARALAVIAHARSLPDGAISEKHLRDDLLRSAWMFAVGAMDAYFCDAYSDLIARTLRAKSLQRDIQLSESVARIKLPIGSVLSPYKSNENWRWRMAARQMMERDNVLSLKAVRDLLNPFFRKNYKFFDANIIDSWISAPNAPHRLFGVTRTLYKQLGKRDKDTARKNATKQMQERFHKIVQRRHDCIHNCDRPKVKLQTIGSPDAVLKVVKDVQFLVEQCNKYIDTEFRQYLSDLGCSPTTLNKLGC